MKKRGGALIFVVLLFSVILISAISILSISYREYLTTTAFKRTKVLRYIVESEAESAYFKLMKEIIEGSAPDFSKPEYLNDSFLQGYNYSYSKGKNQIEVVFLSDTSYQLIKIKATINNYLTTKTCILSIDTQNNYMRHSKEFLQY